MLQASAEDTGSSIESLLVHTFDLGNDVQTLLNGSLFEQNQSQAGTFLAGSAMASMPHDLEVNLATDSILKVTFNSAIDTYFNIHAQSNDDMDVNFQKNCDLSESNKQTCTFFIGNTDATTSSFNIQVNTGSITPAPFEIIVLDMGLTMSLEENETLSVGTMPTLVKTIDLADLDLNGDALEVVVVSVQPDELDDLELRVESIDADGNVQEELTCAPAINGAYVERCVLPVNDDTVRLEAFVHLYNPTSDGATANVKLSTSYLANNELLQNTLFTEANPLDTS